MEAFEEPVAASLMKIHGFPRVEMPLRIHTQPSNVSPGVQAGNLKIGGGWAHFLGALQLACPRAGSGMADRWMKR